MPFRSNHKKVSQLDLLQQECEQLMADLIELQDDLKTVQGIIRHKQQKLRVLNQAMAIRARHPAPVLTCLPGGRSQP